MAREALGKEGEIRNIKHQTPNTRKTSNFKLRASHGRRSAGLKHPLRSLKFDASPKFEV
jgi:hypothetical protein